MRLLPHVILQKLPDFFLTGFQVGDVVIIEMPGLVDALAEMIDVRGDITDRRRKLFLLGVIKLDDVPVNRHFSEIGTEIVGANLLHLLPD